MKHTTSGAEARRSDYFVYGMTESHALIQTQTSYTTDIEIYFEGCFLLLDCPGEAVGIGARVDLSHYFECLQIDDGNETIVGEGDVCTLAVGLDEDASTAGTTDLDALHFLLGGNIENDKLGAGGDEGFGAVGCEL